MAKDPHSSAYEDSDRMASGASHRTRDHEEVADTDLRVVDRAMEDNQLRGRAVVLPVSGCPHYLVSLIGL